MIILTTTLFVLNTLGKSIIGVCHLFPQQRTSSINPKQSLQYSASSHARLKHQWETDMYLSNQWEIDMCVAALVAGFPAVFTQLGADLQVHGSDSRHSGSDTEMGLTTAGLSISMRQQPEL